MNRAREAAAARDAGIALAIDHADRKEPGWSDEAFAVLEKFVAKARRQGEDFTSEQVRDYSESSGLPEPPDHRAWGGVFVRAVRAGLIEHAGFDTSANPRAHSRPINKWRAR